MRSGEEPGALPPARLQASGHPYSKTGSGILTPFTALWLPFPTYSHLWSRPASVLATPPPPDLVPAGQPLGDAPGGLQCCVCLQKLLGGAQGVSWACKPRPLSHVFSGPSGQGRGLEEEGSGPPLLYSCPSR